MDRSEFAALLRSNDEACSMARRALDAGADFHSPRGSVPATHLVGTYEVRARRTAAKGIATVGIAEAVSALRAAGTLRVDVGEIGGHAYGWYFVVFVDHESGALLACTGVEQRARR